MGAGLDRSHSTLCLCATFCGNAVKVRAHVPALRLSAKYAYECTRLVPSEMPQKLAPEFSLDNVTQKCLCVGRLKTCTHSLGLFYNIIAVVGTFYCGIALGRKLRDIVATHPA